MLKSFPYYYYYYYYFLIRSMYFNDCVRINLAHGLSEQLFFTQGVKHGCSLSPLLFALYIASLGLALDSSKQERVTESNVR